MGWTNVYICDAHWEEQEGKRLPLRLVPDGVYIIGEPCYICGTEACIPVRRFIDEVQIAERCACNDEGIVKINGTWYCLNHIGDGFTPEAKAAETMRRVWATDLADAIGLHEFNDPEDVA